MKCPFCRETKNEVYNSRPTKFGSQVWRRRRCLRCKQAFTTYEAPDLGFLSVQKRGGQVEPYSRAKLYSGLYNAFSGSQAAAETITNITDIIEAKVLDMRSECVQTRDIARIALLTLKYFDGSSFLRYFSYQPELAKDPELKKELKKY